MNLELSRSYPIRVVNQTVRFPPKARRLLLIGIDALLLPLGVWLSFWLRLAHPFHPSFQAAGSWMLLAVLLVGLPLYAFTGQYRRCMSCAQRRNAEPSMLRILNVVHT